MVLIENAASYQLKQSETQQMIGEKKKLFKQQKDLNLTNKIVTKIIFVGLRRYNVFVKY